LIHFYKRVSVGERMSFCGVKYASWAGSFALFAAAFATGLEIERAERDRMTRFRDRSALFAGTKPAGDTEVTWGRPKDHKPWW
jgi:hypothetical protein